MHARVMPMSPVLQAAGDIAGGLDKNLQEEGNVAV